MGTKEKYLHKSIGRRDRLLFHLIKQNIRRENKIILKMNIHEHFMT